MFCFWEFYGFESYTEVIHLFFWKPHKKSLLYRQENSVVT